MSHTNTIHVKVPIWHGIIQLTVSLGNNSEILYSNMVFLESRFIFGSGDIIHYSIWTILKNNWSKREIIYSITSALKSRFQKYHILIQKSASGTKIRCWLHSAYTQRNYSEVLLNQPEIRLYLPFSDWFWSKSIGKWYIQSDFRLI